VEEKSRWGLLEKGNFWGITLFRMEHSVLRIKTFTGFEETKWHLYPISTTEGVLAQSGILEHTRGGVSTVR